MKNLRSIFTQFKSPFLILFFFTAALLSAQIPVPKDTQIFHIREMADGRQALALGRGEDPQEGIRWYVRLGEREWGPYQRLFHFEVTPDGRRLDFIGYNDAHSTLYIGDQVIDDYVWYHDFAYHSMSGDFTVVGSKYGSEGRTSHILYNGQELAQMSLANRKIDLEKGEVLLLGGEGLGEFRGPTSMSLYQNNRRIAHGQGFFLWKDFFQTPSGHLVYATKEEKGHYLHIGLQKIGPAERLPAFYPSEEGLGVVYSMMIDGWTVIGDGKVQITESPQNSLLLVDAQGNIGHSDGRRVNVNGQWYGDYTEVVGWAVQDDGTPAVMELKDGQVLFHTSGGSINADQGVRSYYPASLLGKEITITTTDQGESLYVDRELIASGQFVYTPVNNVEMTSFFVTIQQGESQLIYHEGELMGPWNRVRDPILYREEGRLVYMAMRDGKSYLVEDGKERPMSWEAALSITQWYEVSLMETIDEGRRVSVEGELLGTFKGEVHSPTAFGAKGIPAYLAMAGPREIILHIGEDSYRFRGQLEIQPYYKDAAGEVMVLDCSINELPSALLYLQGSFYEADRRGGLVYYLDGDTIRRLELDYSAGSWSRPAVWDEHFQSQGNGFGSR
jgi:hypothetical protein